MSPMDHLLDNPVWNALVSGNRNLANGNETAKFFSPDVAPFVGLKKNTEENFRVLAGMIPRGMYAVFISPVSVQIPDAWTISQEMDVLQMVLEHGKEKSGKDHTGEVHTRKGDIGKDHTGNGDIGKDHTGNGDIGKDHTEKDDSVSPIVPLREKDVPQMLALTQLTNPGPFLPGTIAFGHYEGIFSGDSLVAMAGQRMHPAPYAEISAVCTHPAFTGKGFARKLMMNQIRRIQSASEIPMLHVRAENERAITLYKRLGFAVRRQVCIYLMQSNGKG